MSYGVAELVLGARPQPSASNATTDAQRSVERMFVQVGVVVADE
jgi:hypothetical protein